MAVLTKDQLIASFPNNTTGQIQPFNVRDFVDSVELKYDNWTVVKPSQPEGNKFPDPSGGKITLPPDTVWVINGEVTVANTLVLSNGVVIQSLTGNYLVDALKLDIAAGAIPLFENVSSAAFDLRGLYLSTTALTAAGTGRLFNLVDPGDFNITGCALVDCTFGTTSISAGGSNIKIENTLLGFTADSWLFSGAGYGVLTINACIANTGVLAGDIIDISSAGLSAVILRNNYYKESSPGSFIKTSDSNTNFGIISNNVQEGTVLGTPFISGTDETSINYTFFGNSGISNTIVGGGLVMATNAVVTINAGLGLWAFMAGNGDDTLVERTTRFSLTGDLELTYTGLNDHRGMINLGVSARRSAGSGGVQFSIGVAKNGIPITEPITKPVTSITSVGTLASVTLAAPFALVDGMTVTISGANEPEYNGTFVISNSVPGAGTFDYTMLSAPGVSPATGTITAVLPVEVSIPITLDGTPTSAAIPVPITLTENDTIRPIIRGDGSGTIDTVVENIQMLVS